jgi:hypothetical protein
LAYRKNQYWGHSDFVDVLFTNKLLFENNRLANVYFVTRCYICANIDLKKLLTEPIKVYPQSD